MLAADVARCPGVEDEDDWRDGCEDCMRRTSPPVGPECVLYVVPPAVIVFECAFRIAPEAA